MIKKSSSQEPPGQF